MTKVHQVRRKFHEPFRDVVKGFAEMGYSRRATAEILEINLSYFRQLCTRFDLHKYFKPQSEMRPECRSRSSKGGWPKGKPRNVPRKYSDEYLLSLLRKHPDLTYYQFEHLAPVSASTIQRRFGGWSRAREISLQEAP